MPRARLELSFDWETPEDLAHGLQMLSDKDGELSYLSTLLGLKAPETKLINDGTTPTLEQKALELAKLHKLANHGKISAIKELRLFSMGDELDGPVIGLKEAKNMMDEAWLKV